MTVADNTLSRIIRLIQYEIPNPKITPRRGPPIDVRTKLAITPTNVVEFPFTKSKNNAKKTIAVPSLSKDYPSTKVLNLTLAPNYFSKATTATGSVAESTLPKVKA